MGTDILLFGGQSDVDILPFIREFIHQRGHTGIAEIFLENVSSTLRTSIASLSAPQRKQIPSFVNLEDFINVYRLSSRNAIVDSTLLCVAQLAHYISIVDERPDSLSPEKSIIGLSNGLIAAAAASCFPASGSCIPVAVEAVRIAFRLGVYVSRAAECLQPYGNTDPWSVIVSGITETESRALLVDFHSRTGISEFNKAYISRISPTSITFSGPPDTLQLLSESIRDFDHSYLPALVPDHAPHLYSRDCIIEDIIQPSTLDDPAILSYKPTIPIFSECDGAYYPGTTLAQLLEQAIGDVLTGCQNLGLILNECQTTFTDHGSRRIIPMGSSSIAPYMCTLLEENISARCVYLDQDPEQISAERQRSGNLKTDKIAIVGMSGRFPGAQDLEEFWDVLKEGLDMHKEVPPDRFDARAHYDPSGKGKNKSHTPFGCFVDKAGLFDPRFFNMSPREAAQTDPMQRLALITAFEALEMAGYVPNRTPSTKLDRIGTFYGQTSDDWREINEAQDIDTYFITGGVRAFGPGRINYHFKFSGPSFSVDTACSSSMAALQLACTSLWAGDCDTAITGGVNIMTNPDIFAGLSKGQFLSKVGPCQTFDNDADGYCRGDGVGTIILKRLKDAQADRDNILGVILSAATNHSADAVSITHPHGKTQEFLYKKVLNQARVDPLDISYVEMHGTGTQAGDDTEMRSVTNVFAPADTGRSVQQKLYLGSVKANVGHGEAASGITALIKVLLMLRKNAIPPHIGIKKEINRGFPDLSARNAHLAFRQTPFPRPSSGVRKIFINNFSAAGGNTAIVLEDGISRKLKGIDLRKTHVISVSARALSSFKSNIRRLATYLDENPNVSLSSLSYTTTARRIHHGYRMSFAISDISTLKKALMGVSEKDIQPISPSHRIAFTFTGQGSSYAGLAGELYRTCSTFRENLLELNRIATFNFPSFLPLVDGSVEDVSTLSPVQLQVGLICVQIALTRLWATWGVKPDVVIGHSLGEYAALHAAGVLSTNDTIYLVGSRARLLEDRCSAGSHAMLAVNKSVSSLQNIITDAQVEIACINSISETVLSGESSNIDRAKSMLQEQGIKATKLNVPYAFHSSQIDVIIPEFKRIASGSKFRPQTCTVLSPLLGRECTDADIDEDYLCRHARHTVNFLDALNAGKEIQKIDDKTLFVEIGAHPVCLGFIKSTLGPSTVSGYSLRRKENAWDSLASAVTILHNNGVDIMWSEYHRDFEDALELLELPAYSWALSNFWIDYKNNWCLNKGETLMPSKTIPQLSTTSVQRVVEESFSGTHGRMVAESDISRPDMNSAVSGHLVNGISLCPSSIYGDIGVTIGEYMYRRMSGLSADDDVPGMNVGSMEVPKPLIADGSSKILKITAEGDTAKGFIDITLSSKEGEHAKFIVEFGKRSDWISEWQRTAYLVDARIETLRAMSNEGNVHVLLQAMAYKLFSAFVDYERTFQGMKKVILDGEHLEATAEVIMESPGDNQHFVFPPYWIDSIGHLAGFIMNVADKIDTKNNAYVSHGWESCRFSKPLTTGVLYRTYVRMMPVDGTKMVRGDVYCFEGSTVIGIIGGLKFQCIPRQILNLVLPQPGRATQKVGTREVKQGQKEAPMTNGSLLEHGREVAVQKSSVKAPVSIISQVLAIIAQECGIDVSELADPISFADLGVDSLMQLAISSRMREELELEVSSSTFLECATVGALKSHLSADSELSHSDASSNDVDSKESIASSDSDSESTEGKTPDTVLSETGSSSGHNDECFENHKEHLFSDRLLRQGPVMDIESSSDYSHKRKTKSYIIPERPVNRRASSFLLQGNPKTASKTFFLLPDGGGAAASYAGIPGISPDLAVYGLNSPFMTTPEEYVGGVPGIAEYFVEEIRRRQTQGPYIVGGWSAGGVVAFEACQQLTRAGEKVDSLILIDAPCPLTIEPLPSYLHRWFNTIGLLGDGDPTKVPSWLLPHFQASINALSSYSARCIDKPKAPKTFIIWCEDGVCKYPTDPRPNPYPYGHAQFLLENKTDFGPQLWDALVGNENITISRVGGNHFTMMRQPKVSQLADEIRKAIFS